MKIYYASLTGNVRSFVGKTGIEAEEISDASHPTEPFVLITYTVGFGEVPKDVRTFLAKHGHLMVGVASSGNRNWGDNYAKAGEIISSHYKVPLLLQFELRGTKSDVETFTKKVGEIFESH